MNESKRFHDKDNSRTVTHPSGWGIYITPRGREIHPGGESMSTGEPERAALPLESKKESNKTKRP